MSESTTIGSPRKGSFTATVTLSAYQLVKLNTDRSVSVATFASGETRVGFVDRAVNQGDPAPVALLNGGGSAFGQASASVTTGDALYAATTGKVSATVTGESVGVALEDGAADDVIEILLPH